MLLQVLLRMYVVVIGGGRDHCFVDGGNFFSLAFFNSDAPTVLASPSVRSTAAGVVVIGGGRDHFFLSFFLSCFAFLNSDAPAVTCPTPSYQAISLQCSLHLQPGSISRLRKRGESKKDQPLSLPGTIFSFKLK